MQEINKVAILGAGAMGALFASKFFDATAFSTALIAKGQRLDKLQGEGLEVNGKHYAIPVIDPTEAKETVDLIVVALKHHHLADAVPGLEGIIGESTTFISVMNGLESEEYIGSIYGMERVLFAISVGIDAVRQGNKVICTKPGKHFLGEATNKQISPRVRRVQEAFAKAGLVYETPEDMIRMLWWKFMINVGVNQASAVMRSPYGVFQTDPDAQALMGALMREVIALAKVMDVKLVDKDVEDWYTFLNTLSPQGKTSMLQDIEAGRKTEADVFGGKVVALGKSHGIPTPVNQTVLQIIRVLEQNIA